MYKNSNTVYLFWADRIFINWSKVEMPMVDKPDCKFTYINTKTGKESVKNGFSLFDAIRLAERRREDGRYRNFEFYID